MPLAVVERIAQELLSRLQAMVGESEDYPIDVVEAVRPVRLGGDLILRDRQVILTQGASNEVPELMYPGNPPAVARRQTFNIRCNLMTDEHSDEPIDTTINQFASDVINAITSGNNWHNFNSLAIDAYFLDQEYFSADGGMDGVNIPLAITYRVDETDPTVLRG